MENNCRGDHGGYFVSWKSKDSCNRCRNPKRNEFSMSSGGNRKTSFMLQKPPKAYKWQEVEASVGSYKIQFRKQQTPQSPLRQLLWYPLNPLAPLPYTFLSFTRPSTRTKFISEEAKAEGLVTRKTPGRVRKKKLRSKRVNLSCKC